MKYRVSMNYATIKEVEGEIVSSPLLLPKHSFGIRKEDKSWVVDHVQSGRSLGIKAKTKKQAQEELFKVLARPECLEVLSKTPTIKQAQEGWEHLQSLTKEFKELTEIELTVTPDFRLDIDALLRCFPKHEGTAQQYVINKYGTRADEIIIEILDTPLVTALDYDRGKKYRV